MLDHDLTDEARLVLLTVFRARISTADGQLPSLALPFQPTRPEYLHLMPIVLLESPDSIVEYASGLHKRSAYQRRESVYKNARDEGR